MRIGFNSEHWEDPQGNPAGGTSYGKGFTIAWQNGPLGRGEERREPNGAFVEDVIDAVLDRLVYYQTASEERFKCIENSQAIYHLERALGWLDARTRVREMRGVEGTHEP